MGLLYLLEFYLLNIIYKIYVNPVYEYMGFEFKENTWKICESLILIAIFVFSTPVHAKVRSFYLNFLLSTYLVPSMVLYSYADKSPYAAIVVWSAFATIYIVSAIPLPRLIIANVYTTTFMRVLAVATFCIIASYALIGGLSNFNLNLARVYDFRRDAAAALPGIFGYLSPIFGNVIIPFCIAVAMAHRRYGSVLVFLTLAVLQFGFTAHKGVLFAPFIVIGVYYFLSRFGRYSALLMGILAGLALSLIDVMMLIRFEDDAVWGWYTSLFVRRVLMIPPLLDYWYIDFFSENAKYYWSSSRISLGLVQPPYGGMTAPFVIGEFYFNNPETSANTGFIGSGYAQAGLLGTLFYAAGIGLIISFFESCGKYLGLPFTVAVTIILATSFAATDLLTLFLTHGLAVLILFLMLVRSPETEQRAGSKQHRPASQRPAQTE